MYQRFIAIGRLGRDPEIRGSNGSRVATFSLATSEYVKGEERTEWHRVVVFDERLIETIERHVTKGTLVLIEGQIRTRKWQKQGREGTTTEVVLERFNSRMRLLGRGRGEARVEPEDDDPGLQRDEVRERRTLELQDDLPF
jgi:single-strand DNA-binding protein